MCYHRRIIYATCGHSAFLPKPLIECRLACIDPILKWSTTCELVAHPYTSLRLDRLCIACQNRRDVLLRHIDESQAVRFDEWQWKVSYGMPRHGGKDYWTKKSEEREAQEREKQNKMKTQKTTRSGKRFSWRKSTKVESVASARRGLAE